MEFFTIGVYNSSESEFFKKLTDNNIDTFCDIRQRRGVRGSKYSFVNSTKLQNKLLELNIKYGHILKLAPTVEIRAFQKIQDINKGELKSERQSLSDIFKKEYTDRILNNFDFSSFFESLENINANKIVLFCVEEKHLACHRSLVAEVIKSLYKYNVTHI